MKIYKLRLIVAVTFSVLSAGNVYADDSSGELNFLQEFPVVLSASRLSQPLSDAPSAMTVIDRDMIAASGFRKIPDLFRLVPGMYVSYYKGSQAIVSYHGTSDQYARRMQVLIDGRSIYLAPFSDVDWEALPISIDDIERVEVVRGPSAATHGANSLQGVINILTRDASAVHGTGISINQGQRGISDMTVYAGNSGTKLDYRLTLAYRSDDGFDPRTDEPNNDTLSNDSYGTRLMNFRVNYHPNFADNIDVQMGASNGARGAGFTDSKLNKPHDQFVREGYQQITWRRTLEISDELQLRYYHIRLKKEEATSTNLGSVQINLADSMLSDRNELELQHTAHLDDANRVVWGMAYRSDYIHSENYFLNPIRQNEYRLFAHEEWRISPAWLLNTGLMIENGGLGRTDSSPQIALNYRFLPAHTLRASVSRAYRNPSMLEEQGNWRYPLPPPLPTLVGFDNFQIFEGAGGVRPEKVLSREIGYVGKMAELGLTVDIRFFRDQYGDLIVPVVIPYPVPNPVVDSMFQAANSPFGLEQKGGESSIEMKLTDRASINFNYLRNVIDTDLAGFRGIMPEEQYGLMYTQRVADYFFNLNFYKQSSVSPPDIAHLQEPHQSTDLRIARHFRTANGLRGEISLVVQNLFNRQYTEYIATNVSNRNGYARLSLDF